ncbi:MAG: hypothetical protein Q4C95_04015 [Planctomycetia bacterium]|nr:hypothetical protein [Planctomycetia bacterium]
MLSNSLLKPVETLKSLGTQNDQAIGYARATRICSPFQLSYQNKKDGISASLSIILPQIGNTDKKKKIDKLRQF